MADWKLIYRATDGSIKTERITAGEKWTEGGKVTFLNRIVSGTTMTVETVLEIDEECVVSVVAGPRSSRLSQRKARQRPPPVIRAGAVVGAGLSAWLPTAALSGAAGRAAPPTDGGGSSHRTSSPSGMLWLRKRCFAATSMSQNEQPCTMFERRHTRDRP